MTSPLLALFIRSLREDSRLKFTYFARAGLITVILLFLGMTQQSMGWTNAPGLRFFETVVAVDLVFVILAGVSYFSSAISEEKEEMTLGLLRMTNLNPLSILLGKSTSRLCTAILLFTAQIPFTLLAITLGGISLHQVFAAYLTLGAFLVFVSNLALLASVVCRRTSGAAVLTGLTLLFFFGIVPVVLWFAQLPMRLGLLKQGNALSTFLAGLGDLVSAASPFKRFSAIMMTGFSDRLFTFQIWSNLAIGAVFFLLAWAIFEVFCAEQKESAPGRAGVARLRERRRSLFAPSRPWTRAIAWKDFYFITGGRLWVLIKLLIYGLPLLITCCWPEQLGGPPTWRDFGVGFFWFMVVFICVELAFAAATIFRNERQGQTLSSLAMLPQGIRRVAYQKLLGIIPSLAAAGTYLLLSLPLVARPFLDATKADQFRYSGFFMFLAFLAAQAVFFLHLVAVLSLYVKRGALPLAIAVQFLLLMLGGLTMSILFRGDNSSFVIAMILTGGAVGFLHLHIGHRLETVAAED